MPIYKLEDLPNVAKREKLEVAVVSFGGSGSNTLVEFLQKKGLKTRPRCWQKLLCHCPEPVDLDIPIIYMYNKDARDAFCSQRRRRTVCWKDNQIKLSNGNPGKLSDENLLSLMIKQFKSWTAVAKKDNVMFLTFQEFFTDSGRAKINKFLNKDYTDYPKWGDREKHVYNFDDDKELFDKFTDDLEFIKNFDGDK
jgi:hypothetical protein|tara:strand:- start:3255 stop:3839 length:585 start_codon:yes stop_codon:yes gene_type:complete